MPRMIAPGVLMMLQLRQMQKSCSMLLMTPFFSSSVCHASVRSRKFIHIGKNKDQYDETGLIDILFCQDHGQRIGKKQTDQRADQGKKQRQAQVPSDFPAMVIIRQIAKCKMSLFICQTVIYDHEQRDDYERQLPRKDMGRQVNFLFFNADSLLIFRFRFFHDLDIKRIYLDADFLCRQGTYLCCGQASS